MHTRVQLHPSPQPTPDAVATVVCMWGRIISAESVKGFRSPRELNMTLLHRPYNSVIQNHFHKCELTLSPSVF